MNSIDGEITRESFLAEKIVFVDGLEGCGKSMLAPIISSLDRVELLTYAYEIEYICSLVFLKKISMDAAISMVRMLTDLQLYNTMMGRETNFRFSDVSSVFHDNKPWKYFRRIFQKGDEVIPERIKLEKPILHLTTHRLLRLGEPIFKALNKRVIFIEIVRHPLYMLKQQVLNMEQLVSTVRHFTIYFKYKGYALPYFTYGWEDIFLASNPIEKSIYLMREFIDKTETIKPILIKEYNANIITIPFENFVIHPWGYLKKIENFLETKITPKTIKMMKRQKVPRTKYADGYDLPVYRRCGWEPSKFKTEKDEFSYRRQFALKHASEEAIRVLDNLCENYERKYLNE